jgi:hypothetical protein
MVRLCFFALRWYAQQTKEWNSKLHCLLQAFPSIVFAAPSSIRRLEGFFIEDDFESDGRQADIESLFCKNLQVQNTVEHKAPDAGSMTSLPDLWLNDARAQNQSTESVNTEKGVVSPTNEEKAEHQALMGREGAVVNAGINGSSTAPSINGDGVPAATDLMPPSKNENDGESSGNDNVCVKADGSKNEGNEGAGNGHEHNGSYGKDSNGEVSNGEGSYRESSYGNGAAIVDGEIPSHSQQSNNGYDEVSPRSQFHFVPLFKVLIDTSFCNLTKED